MTLQHVTPMIHVPDVSATVAWYESIGFSVLGTNEEAEDGMTIYGGGKLTGATLNSFGDHRIAMAFAIAGLFASGTTLIEVLDGKAVQLAGTLTSKSLPPVTTFDSADGGGTG